MLRQLSVALLVLFVGAVPLLLRPGAARAQEIRDNDVRGKVVRVNVNRERRTTTLVVRVGEIELPVEITGQIRLRDVDERAPRPAFDFNRLRDKDVMLTFEQRGE